MGGIKDYQLYYEEVDEGRYEDGIPTFTKKTKKRNRSQSREDAAERIVAKRLGKRRAIEKRVRKRQWEAPVGHSQRKRHQRQGRVQNRAR